MIDQVLIGGGPSEARRRAAYESVLNVGTVSRLTSAAELSIDTVIDLEDPTDLAPDHLDQLLASDAFIVSGAPVRGSVDFRVLPAWPDLLAGPLVHMAADQAELGVRTMSKSILVTETPGLAPVVFRAVLALVAMGGTLSRLAACSEPEDAKFDGVFGVGRFCDGSIAYVEACAGCLPGSELLIYEVLGRDEVREYDSRRSLNRVVDGDGLKPLAAVRTDPYTAFVKELFESDELGCPSDRTAILRDAESAYFALINAMSTRGSVVV